MRIGLFLRHLDEEFQITVFRGIRIRAAARGVNLVCCQGETVKEGEGSGSRPFDLAEKVRFDGLLILSPVIFDMSDSVERIGLKSLLPPIPCVSVGIPLPGVASVGIKIQQSFTAIIEHLVIGHGYRRLLFLGGLREHHDSWIREQVFKDTLHSLQASYPALHGDIEYGDFSESSGMDAIRRLLSGVPYDAIVAANDNMALGAMKFLRLQDDPAWSRCAVTGFDDIPQAVLADPPLTSVHQPLEELGARSLDLLMDLIEGRAVPPLNSILASPVIRESCGCGPSELGTFSSGNPSEWGLAAARMKMDRLQSYEAEQRLRQGSNFGRDLSAVTDLTRLLAHLDSYLINMAVGDFHLLLFEGKEVETQGDRGLLVYERKGGRRVVLPEGGQDIGLEEFFSTRPGFPGRSWDLCLSHLMSGEEDLGLALYSVDDWAQPHLTAATPHVANALRRLRVLAEQEDRNRSLELMVDARTKDLTLANEMLTREVELRTAAEAEVLQISEFERRRFGLDLHDDICQRLAGISMYIRGFQSRKPDDPAAILVEMADLVDETLHLTRRYAHASFPIDLERRGLDRVLRSHCETVAIQNRCICRYSSELPRLDPPLDDSQALNVYRIVQEALHNAVRHSGATVLEVIVDVESELCTIRVADNGRGLDGSAQAKGGLGLRSMEYRASQLGAGFRIESRPGMGTVVRLEIPRRTRA